MKKREPTDLAASVRQRLLNLSKERGQDFNVVLTQYALERLLYRLSKSRHANQFVLKGAMLFAVWAGHSGRATRDLDFLGYGEASLSRLRQVFTDICAAKVRRDALLFVPETIRVREIREAQEYGGQRVLLEARIGKARIPIQVDVGFGDVVTPKPKMVRFPVLLDMPPPRVRAYSHESVVAEKLHAMVVLGMLNSRMKDFYDLYEIAKRFSFESQMLAAAIRATFACRQTPVPNEAPVALTPEFAADEQKAAQWQAFLRRSGIQDAPKNLAQVVKFLNAFLKIPLRTAASEGENDVL